MLKRFDTELQLLNDFLHVKTPQAWLDFAANHIPLLLIDHAHCERKAAATAINFISKYPEKKELVEVMSPLAREELLHFEKVIQWLAKKEIQFCPLQPSGYATHMHKLVTSRDVLQRLCDQLIIGAIIEARSCERFYAIIPYLNDADLAKFYGTLLKSEARHFEDYLRLAKLYGGDIDQRLKVFYLWKMNSYWQRIRYFAFIAEYRVRAKVNREPFLNSHKLSLHEHQGSLANCDPFLGH